MIDIKNILKLLLTDKLSWEEKKALTQKDYVEKLMRKQWDNIETDSINPFTEKQIWNKIEKRITHKTNDFNRKAIWMTLAALIIIIFGIFNILKLSQQQTDIKFVEIYAKVSQLYTLPDETKVWMNEGDTLKYTNEFGKKERRVWINGTALFDVTKNKKCPFIVCLNQSQIKVLGTSFLIDDKDQDLSEITLYSGTLEFSVDNSKDKYITSPMEKIVYNKHNGNVKLEKALSLFWENGQYRFYELRLDSLISFINNKYKIGTSISKDFEKNNLMSGSIQYNEPLESVISKLCFNLKAKYKIENNKILIYK